MYAKSAINVYLDLLTAIDSIEGERIYMADQSGELIPIAKTLGDDGIAIISRIQRAMGKAMHYFSIRHQQEEKLVKTLTDTEFRLFAMLRCRASFNGYVKYSSYEMSLSLKLNQKTVQRTMRKLIQGGYVKKLKTSYIINPLYYQKGGLSMWSNDIRKWQSL